MRINAKFPGTCGCGCGTRFAAGESIEWTRGAPSIRVSCLTSRETIPCACGGQRLRGDGACDACLTAAHPRDEREAAKRKARKAAPAPGVALVDDAYAALLFAGPQFGSCSRCADGATLPGETVCEPCVEAEMDDLCDDSSQDFSDDRA